MSEHTVDAYLKLDVRCAKLEAERNELKTQLAATQKLLAVFMDDNFYKNVEYARGVDFKNVVMSVPIAAIDAAKGE